MMHKTMKFIILVLVFLTAYAQNFGGQQALEQLRMFQNKPDNSAPKTQSEINAAVEKKASNSTNPEIKQNIADLQKSITLLSGNGGANANPNQAANANNNPPQASNTPPQPNFPGPSVGTDQPPALRTQNNGNLPSDEDEKIIDNMAYDQVEEQIFPMSEKQIKQLHSKYEHIELAKTAEPSPPTPVATSQIVNLSPGSTPPVIRLAKGFVTSLVFLDSTGSPWPISAYDLGDPSIFNIQWDKTGNTLMIQASKLYNYGNMAVRLEGLNTPVMLTLIPGQKEVDYRVDMRIQGIGPNAQMPVLGDNLPPHANRLLLHVLDGVPPPGSTRLTISGGDARAWLYREKMFVRTNLTVLSPAWLSTMTSADGMHAYEMQKSPVILVTWHGKVMQLKVEGL
jgi:intracellular multiplication protein IcmK